MKLQRNIHAYSLLFIAVGGMIGSGWLFGPFYAAQVAGPAAILSWVIGGILMMCIALTFAELATTFPVAGGMVRFVQFSHGSMVSFTLAWVAWLASVVVSPIETLAILQYASTYVPGLTHRVSGAHTLSGLGVILAALLMLLMVYFNSVGVKWFAKTNNSIIFWKLVIPITTMMVLFACNFHTANFVSHQFMPGGFESVLSALPTAGVIFSYIGYSAAIQMAGEAKNPQKAVPLAVIGSILFCIALFVLLQTAFIGAVPVHSIDHGWPFLNFTGDAGPIAGILLTIGLVWYVKLLYADAVISPFGTALIYTASTARINFAMSQNDHMPKFFQLLNKRGVPLRAMLVNYLIGLLLFLPFPGWQQMVSFLVSCFVLSYAVGPIALISLRKKLPDRNRPFRLPCATVMSLFAFYVCNLIIYWTGWSTIWRMLLVIGLGYVYLALNKRFKLSGLNTLNALWLFPYLGGIGIISYFGSFGGGMHIITFGWDFVVIALFSISIYMVAVFSVDHSGEVKL